MEDQKFEFKINSENPELIIRTGEALAQKEPVKLALAGNIFSVSNFLSQRTGDCTGVGLQVVDGRSAVVVVDEKEMSIALSLDPNNHYGTTVFGKLELTDELKQFSINTAKTFTREELVKLFRFNKRFFDSADAHDKVLVAYQKLQISTAGQLNQEADTRGNKTNNFAKTVDSSGVPEEFVLNIPIFKGFDPQRFRVEICLDATDASVRFWFESVELHELIESEKKRIIKEQLESCNNFPIIYK